MDPLMPKDNFERPPHPVRYELIDKDGKTPIFRSSDRATERHLTFETAQAAAEWAGHLWPDQSQDHDRTGKGWDVQIVGADQ